MDDLIKLILDPVNMLTAVVGIFTFFACVTLASPFLNRSSLEGRMKSVANRREELRRRSREELAKKTGGSATTLRHADDGMFKTIVDRLQLSRLLEDTSVVDKLA